MSEVKNKTEVNKDLANERAKCNFKIEEITFILDGGEKNTAQRRTIENIALNDGASLDKVPDECMTPTERYENAVRKSVLYSKLVKEKLLDFTGLEALGVNSPAIRRTADAFFKDMSPFLLHLGMFVPTIMGQCTPEQQAHWLPRALDMQIIGTYAQTELGHGTFIRGLETTATYDPKTEEFVMHSPKLTSFKWWAGGLGHTVNYCIVVAQLYTQGKCHGVHPFIVQVRDEETHMPLPGIKIGDIGPRMGFNTANNGFLGFEHHRIPREYLMMKNAQVLKDGTYVKTARHGKLTYGTMVFVRVMLVSESAFNLAKAVTIAVRYSAVRRQSEPRPGQPEPQILDYLTQQHKLFICIATAHALRLSADWLWKTFSAVLADMRDGNTDSLPEYHYTRTYEGDYTVLLLQTARFLIKAWEQAEEGKPVTPTVSYLADAFQPTRMLWDSSPEGICKAFQGVAAGKISTCVKSIRKRVETGMTFEDAWELTAVQLVAAAEAHCRAVICDTYHKETARITAHSSPNVKVVMTQLSNLYLLYWALERTGDLLRYSSISEQDLNSLQLRYEKLLTQIRPNAVGLVDSFDLRDEILNSTLGAYDGRVYERLMEEALKAPLNAEPVNQSFHKYLKPLMQGKL